MPLEYGEEMFSGTYSPPDSGGELPASSSVNDARSSAPPFDLVAIAIGEVKIGAMGKCSMGIAYPTFVIRGLFAAPLLS